MAPQPDGDTFEAKLMLASDSDLQELLCGGWILQHYLDKHCPSEVAEWLFHIMCRHRDQHIISSSLLKMLGNQLKEKILFYFSVKLA